MVVFILWYCNEVFGGICARTVIRHSHVAVGQDNHALLSVAVIGGISLSCSTSCWNIRSHHASYGMRKYFFTNNYYGFRSAFSLYRMWIFCELRSDIFKSTQYSISGKSLDWLLAASLRWKVARSLGGKNMVWWEAGWNHAEMMKLLDTKIRFIGVDHADHCDEYRPRQLAWLSNYFEITVNSEDV